MPPNDPADHIDAFLHNKQQVAAFDRWSLMYGTVVCRPQGQPFRWLVRAEQESPGYCGNTINLKAWWNITSALYGVHIRINTQPIKRKHTCVGVYGCGVRPRRAILRLDLFCFGMHWMQLCEVCAQL